MVDSWHRNPVVHSKSSMSSLGRLPSIGPEPSVNPFANPRTLNPFRMAFTILMLPLLLLRLICLFGVILLGYLSVKVALIGVKDPLSKPFTPWRRSCLWPVRFSVRAVLFLFGYYWIPVKGSCAPRDVAPIIVSNHISFIEPLFVFYANLPVILSALENAQLPIVGVFLHALQIIAVDRTSPSSRHDAGAQIKRRSIDNRWPHIAIFPEGTTTNGKSLISFKLGAFSQGLPVQPMVFKYRNVNPAWVETGPFPVLLLLMTQPINFMKVEYLAVAVPERNDIQHPRNFAEKVRRSMAQALNITWTDHTFLDAKLAMEAVKLKQPKELSFIEFGTMEKLFHLNYETAKEYLTKFTAMDVSHSGYLRIEQFLAALNLPLTPSTKAVFQLFDKSEKGFINFREFVAGMSFLSKESSFSRTIEAAFHACDVDRDSLLSRTEVEDSLKRMFPNIETSKVLKLFSSLDLDHDGVITWEEFSNFLKVNPEYLAVIMAAHPELLSKDAE